MARGKKERKLRRKLTDTFVKTVKPPAKGQLDYCDALTPGFALRVSAGGRKTWTLLYRVKAGPDKGKQRRMTIGQCRVKETDLGITLPEAREKARTILSAAAAGGDPSKDKRAAKKAPATEQTEQTAPNAFKLAVTKYLDTHAGGWSAKHETETRRIFNRYVNPVWGSLAIRDITDDNADQLIKDVARDSGPIMANRVHGALGKLFKWCLAPPRGYVDKSPVVYIPKPSTERDRERTLDEKELVALWKVADKIGYPHGPAVQLLILTGQRNREVAGMNRSELNLKKQAWTLTRERTKSKRTTDIPLSPLAVEILEGIPSLTGRHIFTTGNGDKPIVLGDKIKKQIDKMLGDAIQEPWRFHDLRRTLSSAMSLLKVPQPVTTKILNHGPRRKAGSIDAIYDRHEYTDEKRAALAAYARYIAALLDDWSHNAAREAAEERYHAELRPAAAGEDNVVRLRR